MKQREPFLMLVDEIGQAQRTRGRCDVVRQTLVSALQADASIEALGHVSEGGFTSWRCRRGGSRFVLRFSDPGLRPEAERQLLAALAESNDYLAVRDPVEAGSEPGRKAAERMLTLQDLLPLGDKERVARWAGWFYQDELQDKSIKAITREAFPEHNDRRKDVRRGLDEVRRLLELIDFTLTRLP